MMDKFFYLIIEGMKNTWRHKVTALTAIFSLFISITNKIMYNNKSSCDIE